MMNENVFVYDTYALIEILNRNHSYENYLGKTAIINNFIFAEFCYNLIKDKVKNREDYIEEMKSAVVSVEPETLVKAMEFRYKNKKRKLSMTDCVSYIMARELGVKFLTGDKEFENLEGVEFVK